MKVILVLAMSLDGKTTKWHDGSAHEWVSQEDQKHFSSLIQSNTALIMGRQTYFDARPRMKLSPKTLRVVITTTPEKYQELVVPGQLEFSNLAPRELVDTLQGRGHKQVLLLTGETLSTLFLKEKLIDEIWVTVEPALFGQGNGIVQNTQLDIQLELSRIEKLNQQGSLLLRYKVI